MSPSLGKVGVCICCCLPPDRTWWEKVGVYQERVSDTKQLSVGGHDSNF